MDVFGVAVSAAGEFLRDAAIAAAHELRVLEIAREPRTLDDIADAIGVGAGRRRLRRLLDVLVALGVLARRRASGQPLAYQVVRVPARPVVARAGWGLIADVIRSDRALPVEGWETERRMHKHLAASGAAAARDLAVVIACASGGTASALLDLGGGAGAYSHAWLAACASSRATLVDYPEVVGLAREHLAAFGGRASFVASDIRAALLGDAHDVALLANVLHLHDESIGAALVEAAVKAVRPGGLVVVKDLRMDEGRAGPLEGLLFALNMTVYTGGGDVYEGSQIRSWFAAAGLVDIEEHRLASSPDAIVVIGRKPVEDEVARELDSELSRMGKVAWRELEVEGRLRAEAQPRRLELPSPLRRVLSRALADEAHAPDATRTTAADLRRHYTELMPRMRVTQIVGTDEPAATLMHAPLDWARLPRLTAALDAVFALLADCDVDPELPLGFASAAALRAHTPTLGELYTRTHYGACMPLLYGYPADLAYFMSRGLELHATIDRYLTVPVIHELCHVGRHREALPLHLDECVAGYLGVRVWPEFAYPAPGEDDAIYAAPWLSQIGQALVHAFGLRAIVRGHAGTETWAALLPAGFLAAAAQLAWDDWRARRTLHFLADTLAPEPWLALAQRHATAPPDAALDRQVVEDALRAMCLDNVQLAGSFRARTALPTTPITVDARGRSITTAARSSLDYRAPWYWLPSAVANRLVAAGLSGYTLQLTDLAAIPAAAAAICDAEPAGARDGFALVLG